MILKIQLILCFLAFLVNALNAQSLIVIVFKYIEKDLIDNTVPMKNIQNDLLHGRITPPLNPSNRSITKLVGTGNLWLLLKKERSTSEQFWSINQRFNRNSICVNWASARHDFGGKRCHTSSNKATDLMAVVNHVFDRFKESSANLAMMFFHKKEESIVLGSQISAIKNLLAHHNLSGQTSVFVISALGANGEDRGHYYAFGPKIRNGITGDVELTSFFLIFCGVLQIDCPGVHLDRRHVETLRHYIDY